MTSNIIFIVTVLILYQTPLIYLLAVFITAIKSFSVRSTSSALQASENGSNPFDHIMIQQFHILRQYHIPISSNWIDR